MITIKRVKDNPQNGRKYLQIMYVMKNPRKIPLHTHQDHNNQKDS